MFLVPVADPPLPHRHSGHENLITGLPDIYHFSAEEEARNKDILCVVFWPRREKSESIEVKSIHIWEGSIQLKNKIVKEILYLSRAILSPLLAAIKTCTSFWLRDWEKSVGL